MTNELMKSARFILPMFVVAAFTGCKVGPNYVRPEAQVNTSWFDESAAVYAAENVNQRWWESFNDPTLSALIESAYQENLTLRAAGLRVIEARARRGIAIGEFFPQLQQATGSIGATELSGNSPDGQGDRSFGTDNIGFQAAWELDFWGKFSRGIESADAELLFTIADYDAVLTSLAADVAQNYVLYRAAQEQLKITEENVRLQKDTFDLTEIRFDQGAVSEIDVATARGTLAITRARIPDLQNTLVQSRIALSILLGRSPSLLEEELRVSLGAPTGVPKPPAVLAAGIPADLLARRPDVRAAERLAAAQSARIGIATADLYPSISILGSTGFSSSTYQGARSPELDDLFDSSSFTGFIGLEVKWPIFNYGRIKNNIRVEDARYEQAVAVYQESVLRAASEVEAGLSAFLRAGQQVGYQEESVSAYRRAAEISLIQYRNGAVDFVRVNDAQTQLVEQESRYILFQAGQALGAIQTYRALGGGWELRTSTEFVDDTTVSRMRERTDWGDVLQSPTDVELMNTETDNGTQDR